MNKVVIWLAFLVSLTAANTLQRSNLGGRIGMEQHIIGSGNQRSMSQEELQRQKFLLDILMHIHQPIVDEELLQLGQTLIMEPNRYLGQIDDEMLNIIELLRNQRSLGKNEMFSIFNEDHARQVIGLYRLLVSSCDWGTFQRNVCFARLHINDELLVNSLLLAVRDREDTRELIMPSIHEILPELFYGDDVLRKFSNIETSEFSSSEAAQGNPTPGEGQSIKPSLLELIEIKRGPQWGARPFSWWDRAQLWMPWHEFRVALAFRRIPGEKLQALVRQENKLVMPVQPGIQNGSGLALLTEDIGLGSFWYNLINDVILNENELQEEDWQDDRNLEEKRLAERVGEASDLSEEDRKIPISSLSEQWQRLGLGGLVGQDGQEGLTVIKSLLDSITLKNGERNVDVPSEKTYHREETADTDRMLHVGRRRFNKGRENTKDMDSEENMIPWMQKRRDISNENRVIIESDEELGPQWSQNHWLTKLKIPRSGLRRGSDKVGNNIDDLPETTIDDARLLHINRRRLAARSSTAGWEQRRRGSQNQRDLFLNMIRGSKISNGRDVVDDEPQFNMGAMDMDMINLDKMNTNGMDMREMKDIGTMDMLGMKWNKDRKNKIRMNLSDRDMTNSVERRQENLQPGIRSGIWKNDWIQEPNIQWSKKNQWQLPTTSIDSEHLLHVNRRHFQRKDEGSSDEGGVRLGVSRRQRIGSRRYNGEEDISESPVRLRGMEDIGTEHWSVGKWKGRDSGMQGRRGLVRCVNAKPGIYIGPNIEPCPGIYDGKEDEASNSRVTRSVSSTAENSARKTLQKIRGGELLLHSLQQLMARINLERISLGLRNLDVERLMQQSVESAGLTESSNKGQVLSLDTQRNRLILEKINDVEERLNNAIEQQLRNKQATSDQSDTNEVIGEVLIGRVPHVGITKILQDVLQTTQESQEEPKWADALAIRDPIIQHLLNRLVKVIDFQRQQQEVAYQRKDISDDSVVVNDVNVDQLQTYIDTDDADLINLLDQREQGASSSDTVPQKVIVARQKRLNHKTFTISTDVTTDHAQQVVVRTWLLPKVDADGRMLSVDEARLNALLLDATLAELQVGRNTIKRKSKDIQWTSRDTTPITEIYLRVMQAIDGKGSVPLDSLVGNNCRWPHRLLLPRGRVEGLPMQLLVVVTPVREEDQWLQRDVRVEDIAVCGIGIGALTLDALPLGFPLDRKTDNVNEFISFPNLLVKDVKVFHDEKARMSVW